MFLVVSEEENSERAFFGGELFGGGLGKRQECDEREWQEEKKAFHDERRFAGLT